MKKIILLSAITLILNSCCENETCKKPSLKDGITDTNRLQKINDSLEVNDTIKKQTQVYNPTRNSIIIRK